MTLDLTERDQAVNARRESEARSRFLSAMSQELRTPLHSIMGYTQLLERRARERLEPRQLRYLDHIAFSGRHLLDLISDLIDLTKIQSGEVAVGRESIRLGELVGEAVSQVFPLAEARSIRLSARIPPQLTVPADRRCLHQVLGNLLANAIKFSPAQSEVRVNATRGSKEVEIAVTDRGSGIDPADHGRIFEEFVQIERGRNRGYDGTGLGLFISRQLAELMGGRVTVVSALGEGSTFTIHLPRS